MCSWARTKIFFLKTWKYSPYPLRWSQKLLIKKKKLTFLYVDMIRLKFINGTKNGIFITFPYQNDRKKDSWWLAKENSQNMFHLHS